MTSFQNDNASSPPPSPSPSSSSSSTSSSDDASLPFPKPLDRPAFLAPDFAPASFLETLADRYQTIEDLRSELRGLNQTLGRELLHLVNDKAADFLSLGTSLRGGGERVEEIRVGLWGLQRQLGTLHDALVQRRAQVAALLDEKRSLGARIQEGKALLEWVEQMEDLEHDLMLPAHSSSTLTSPPPRNLSDDSDDDADDMSVTDRVEHQVRQYQELMLRFHRHRPAVPLVAGEADRLSRIRSALSLDLQNALQAAGSTQGAEVEGDGVETTDRLRSLVEVVRVASENKAEA